VVEHHVANVMVVSSNLITRSTIKGALESISRAPFLFLKKLCVKLLLRSAIQMDRRCELICREDIQELQLSSEVALQQAACLGNWFL
ncbi:MAG: hypothetical protein V3V10_03005, partial [Planctomycetota bacterium]